jgi:hypothetical protein
MDKLQDTKVSIFGTFKSNEAKTFSIDEALASNKMLRDKVEAVRSAKDKNEQQERKAELPVITWSGVFEGGHSLSNLQHYNNLICVDFDNLPDVHGVKTRLQSEPCVYAMFISPSGNGLKVIVPLADNEAMQTYNNTLKDNPQVLDALSNYHRAQFDYVATHFSSSHEIIADPSGKDISRLCFISHDQDLYVNPSFTPLPLVPIEQSTIDINVSAEDSNTIADETEDIELDAKALKKITLKGIAWKLRIVSPDDYTVWRNVGFALYHHFNGSLEAFNVFVQWSKSSSKFKDAEDCRKLVWECSDNISSDRKVSIRTILALHYKAGDALLYKPILNDTERKHALYALLLSDASSQAYLIQKRDGYKASGKRDVADYITKYFFNNNVTPKKHVTEHIIDNLILITDRYTRMSCCDAGIKNIQGKKYLIEQSAPIIQPVSGEWSIIKRICYESLSDKDREHLFSRIKLDLEGYMRRNFASLGQANLFIGKGDTGKSTFCNSVYVKLLGGSASGDTVVLGKSRFNKSSLEYAVTVCDDTLKRPTSMAIHECRAHLAQLIKQYTV